MIKPMTEEEVKRAIERSKANRFDKPTMEVNVYGDKEWLLNGKLHREDGPAVEFADGSKSWYLNDERHREDGPAIECANGGKSWYLNGEEVTEEEVMGMSNKPTMEVNVYGDKEWLLNGKLHREDGPALEYTNGDKFWHLNGKLHREDGPAVEWVEGDKGWYLEGKLHREDGPAIEFASGDKMWYLNGEEVTEEEVMGMSNKPVMEVDECGDKERHLDGKLHREGGPAMEYTNGTKRWYLNGKLHRQDGPAYEGANGDKAWYLNGELHRQDGPAIEYTKGDKVWYLKGKLHREDGPAIGYSGGPKKWYLEGKLHREDGPAIEYTNGGKMWYLNGEEVTEEEVMGNKQERYADFVESMVLTEGSDRLVENTLGLVGEAGEVAEKIKKKVRDGNIDIQGLQKELGDVIFYWYALHGAFGLDPKETIKMNVEKLSSRKERGTIQGSGDER